MMTRPARHLEAVPGHLPRRLTISLWDFSWFTQTTAGEPFADLDAAFGEAVDRGYNTVRICAMPFLLFGTHAIDHTRLRLERMGEGVGQGTRWYDVAGGALLDGRAHLLALFEAAERHGCYVILSSWEYQQSPAFLEGSEWYEALMRLPHGKRHAAMADAMSACVQFLKDHGHGGRIAYAELHNEVDLSRLSPEDLSTGDPYHSQTQFVHDAVEDMKAAHPDVLQTVCYGIPPYRDMSSVPDNGEVAHFHVYVYGVLAALEQWAGVRAAPPAFPSPELRSLLREGAPPFESRAGLIDDWRIQATGVSPSMFYSYDWVDTTAWDRWLYEHYQSWKPMMEHAITEHVNQLATWAHHRKLPFVIGEGWVGYTPLHAEFEDGPVGQGIAEHALTTAMEVGAWGVVLGSNSAPHHPGWANREWQRRWNDLLKT